MCLSARVVIFLCSVRLNGLSIFRDGVEQDKLTALHTYTHNINIFFFIHKPVSVRACTHPEQNCTRAEMQSHAG